MLFVGRLVPENNAHVLVEAFRGLDTELSLVIVGDAPYAEEYQARLKELRTLRRRHGSSSPVTSSGPRTGNCSATRRSSSLPTEVGGTHPVIFEAMAAGACVVVNDHAPNLETVGGAGQATRRRRSGGPAASARRAARRPSRPWSASAPRRRARARLYSWDAVTDAYERLAEQLAARRGRGA